MHASLDLALLERRLRHHIDVLTQSPRVPGSAAHRNAEEYIAGTLSQFGFLVQEASTFDTGIPCTNFLTKPLPDAPDLPVLVVGAHYDTVHNSPGADDNGTAVAALLELARWINPPLSGGGFTTRLQLAAYDLEEFGMIGSLNHSAELKRTGAAVRGMISLEMLGYTDHQPGSQQLPPQLAGLYPDVANFIGICGNESSRDLVEIVTAAMKSVDGLPVQSIAVPGCGETLPPVRLSDHSSFWDEGFRALMITDTSFMRNPHYHKTTDTADTLDFPFLAKVTAGVCEAVGQLLRA
ncbi:MAG: M28 family peptidase [Gemmataceae bacterium]|nr:M28 family peptidase [Gemmataceae bacterium]